ncbi:MAG: hypothetical protein LBJ96_03665, partial [Holosporaceae bacterium]|nr:hypothetical protein [Holosporaceae bacterium]
QFNEIKFLENVQKIHLNPEELSIYSAIPDAEVREKLEEFVKYGKNPRFSAALDEICENIVGRTMFKVLITKLKNKKKIMHIEPHDEDGSKYKKFIVYVNLSFYEENGTGVSLRKYFYLDEKGEIKTKLKSLAGSVFHEFCHGLHDISGTDVHGIKRICTMHKIDDAWRDDEELRTITCFNHDSICDHCFDFCQSFLKNEPFLPRYSHGGCRGTAKPKEKYTNCISASQKFMDGWKEYML